MLIKKENNYFTPSGFVYIYLFFYNHSIPSGLKKNLSGIEEKPLWD